MAQRFLVPALGPDGWRALLADPEKHWRAGYSARSLAYCWEAAQGLPREVAAALRTSEDAALREAELLLGVPEHQVPLPGGSRPSQTDLWCLARGAGELVSIAVEGKVSEPFGPTVDEWLVDASAGKRRRLSFLAECLGLEEPIGGDVRYQLLHRTASAVIEARRFGAAHAMLLVHSFSQTHEWLDDYRRLVALYDATGETGTSYRLRDGGGVTLHAAWVTGDPRFLEA